MEDYFKMRDITACLRLKGMTQKEGNTSAQTST